MHAESKSFYKRKQLEKGNNEIVLKCNSDSSSFRQCMSVHACFSIYVYKTIFESCVLETMSPVPNHQAV